MNNALYLGSLDSPQLQRVMSAQSKVRVLQRGAAGLVALLYYRDGNLESRAFDVDRNVLGDPQAVIAGVDYGAAGITAFFEAASNGRVIIARRAGTGGTQFTWYERDGRQTGTLGEPGDLFQPRLSPRGDRLAFNRPDPKNGNRDVWTIELDRGVATPLTRHAANDWHPVWWSADGAQMLFNSDRGGASEGQVFLKKSLDAASEESRVLELKTSPTDWSRDKKWIAAVEYAATTSRIAVIDADDPRKIHWIDGPFRIGGGRFSPDGKWIAYVSDETGRSEVFVRPLANGAAAGEKLQISESGADFPIWRPDGQELFFMTEDATVHAAPTGSLRVDKAVPRARALFRPCPGSRPQTPPMTAQYWGTPYDTRDGKRFIVNCSMQSSREYVALLSWALPARR